MSTAEHSQTAIITLSSQTCWSSLKTLHDLPSSYSVNGAYFITGSVEHHSNEIFNHFQFTWTTIMPIIIVLCTILGNSLICLVALIDRHLRHRSNVFFISLSLTNILFSSTVMTFSIMYNLMKPENFSDSLVKVFLSLDKLFCTATILHLVVMAFDRFSHIKAPLKYSRRLKFRFLFLILSGLWFLSILIAILPIQLNWHTSDYRECISSTSSVVGATTTTQIPESSTSQYIENKNCTYSSTHSSRLSSSSEMSTPSKAEFITPTNNIQINNFPCIHQIDFFYALTNAIFSFFIPLILMVTIYTRLFLLTKQHISRLNFYPNSTKCPHDLSFSETINGKQLFYTSQVSPNTMSKRKSLSSARTVYLDPNYDLTNSLRSSLTVSTDVLKPRPRLSRSHLGASLRSVQITSRHGCLSVTKKAIAVHCKTSTGSFSSSEHSTRRKYSLPGLCLPLGKSSNPYPNGDGLSRQQMQFNSSDKQMHKAHKAAITLGVILGSFTVCWLPYFTINCMASFCKCVPKEVIFAATWLGYFNACLNSVVYSLLNNKFRTACAKLLCAWHYNRERRHQYGLDHLKHFGDTPIQLALGRVPWHKECEYVNQAPT